MTTPPAQAASPVQPSGERWSADFLNRWRAIGDPSGDRLVDDLFQTHGVPTVNLLMSQLVDNAPIVLDGLPPEVETYLTSTAILPAWANAGQMKAGADFFDEHGVDIVLMLFCASLPVLYANAKGAQVLGLTQRMTTRLHRRIVETAQFVLDVTAPDAFAPHGYGIRTAQKVRLLHAAMRHFILDKARWRGHWEESWGVPINQTDLAGTMLSFSVTPIQGMERAGIDILPAEKEAYLHLWKVIGHVMGVHEDLMPTDYPDAVRMMDQWCGLYHAPSEVGRTLQRVLLDMFSGELHFPGAKALVTCWTRLFVGKETADQLGVGPYNWAALPMRIQLLLWRIMDRFALDFKWLNRIARYTNHQILYALEDFERGGSRPTFQIPLHLRDDL